MKDVVFVWYEGRKRNPSEIGQNGGRKVHLPLSYTLFTREFSVLGIFFFFSSTFIIIIIIILSLVCFFTLHFCTIYIL